MQVTKSIWPLLALVLWIVISMYFLDMIGRRVDISHLDNSHTPNQMSSSSPLDTSFSRENSGYSFLFGKEDAVDDAPIIQALLRNADIYPALSTEKQKREKVSLSRPLVGWSTDFHISPIADIKSILSSYQIDVQDYSLSGHCHLTNTCAATSSKHTLQVLNQDNGIHLGDCPNRVRTRFYDTYKDNANFVEKVDMVICTHAASLCEVYMPFNKSLVVVASTRYEIGRHSEERWQEWNENLRRIAGKEGNVVAANNIYDLRYMQYFTGMRRVVLLPGLANYITARYAWVPPGNRAGQDSRATSAELRGLASTGGDSAARHLPTDAVLLGPSRSIHPTLSADLEQALHKWNYAHLYPSSVISGMRSALGRHNICPIIDPKGHSHSLCSLQQALQIIPIRSLYPHYEYTDLAAHPAMVLLPYQISFMSFFEYYKMNIPLFVPSRELLAQWHMDYNILKERSWNGVYGNAKESSDIRRHPSHDVGDVGDVGDGSDGGDGSSKGSHMAHDPNNEFSLESVRAWVGLADFYTWPHVTTFDSFEQLFSLLATLDLLDISQKMRRSYNRIEQLTRRTWEEIMQHVDREQSSGGGYRRVGSLPRDVNEALWKMYGYRLDRDCTSNVRNVG